MSPPPCISTCHREVCVLTTYCRNRPLTYVLAGDSSFIDITQLDQLNTADLHTAQLTLSLQSVRLHALHPLPTLILSSQPRILQVSTAPRILLIDDFLTPQQCLVSLHISCACACSLTVSCHDTAQLSVHAARVYVRCRTSNNWPHLPFIAAKYQQVGSSYNTRLVFCLLVPATALLFLRSLRHHMWLCRPDGAVPYVKLHFSSAGPRHAPSHHAI
jgi:hypothetical protein